MNPFEMVVLIVAIVIAASIIRARYGHDRRHRRQDGAAAGEDVETQRLREEVRGLKERVAVLERIATDSGNRLEHEIEQLRDRPVDRI